MPPVQFTKNPMQQTLSPIVTGASVIGLKYQGGVLLAADTCASYGSNQKYKDVTRIKKVGNYTLMGFSGELSDFQYLGDTLDELDMEDFLHEDACSMGPHEYASYIGRVMYNRRSKMNPLYNQFIVCGKKNNEPAKLTFVDHQGTAFDEDFIATGFGNHLAMPILRNEWKPDMSVEDAKTLITKCMNICFYRDCNGYCRIQFSHVIGNEQVIEPAIELNHYWGHPAWLRKSLEGSTGATADTW